MLHAVKRYCIPTAVGPTVLPSIEGFLTVVAAGGPPLLLLCGVVLCVVRWRRALSLPQIISELAIILLYRVYNIILVGYIALPSFNKVYSSS